MKKLLFVFAVIMITMVSCNVTTQGKVETSVKNFLKENLNDPSSYEPISFDSLENRMGADGDWEIELEIASLELELELELSKLESNIAYDALTISLKNQLDSLKEIKENLEYKVIGYCVGHKYRAKNGFGALISEHSFFNLDTNFKVISTKSQAEKFEEELDDWANEMEEALKKSE